MPCNLHTAVACKPIGALDQNDRHAVAGDPVEHGLEARTVGDGIGARYRSIVELGNDDVAVRLGERRNGRTLPVIGTHSRTGIYGISCPIRGSVRLDARELDHLGPLLGFVSDQLSELSGRTRR